MRVASRSKAAILCFVGRGWVSSVFSGRYLATSSVAGVLSLGLRSFHVVRSFGFWEAGVKKLATADSMIAGC